MTLGPMTEATAKVSRAVPAIVGALDGLVRDLCGDRVPFMFFAFTDGRSSYASNAESEAEAEKLVSDFRRWLGHMEAKMRGEAVSTIDAPISNEVSIAMAAHMRDIVRELSSVVDEIAGEHVLIAFVGFPQGVGQYASNANRTDVVKALREWMTYKDAGMEDVPAHNFM